MDKHASYASHPVKDRATHKQKCLPLSLHGDGVAVSGVAKSWAKSLEAYTWNSLLGKGPTVVTNFMIFCFFPKLITKMPGFDMRVKFFQNSDLVSVLVVHRKMAEQKPGWARIPSWFRWLAEERKTLGRRFLWASVVHQR